ncbi:chromosome partitioning protein ParA [Bifidobacterium lemurum]|uniref:Chromosome partitioning protein ParA n=1 Tax=Bifidobacterium lemurum TaxID=1603886 RepID=A0A261FTN4_9BIFI|nr:ParA family protein [Bifidobacterium lemurum]OZG62561.1 chromosome partitioning protein ParA [Bifidobacterium lemurum]QOL33893.1 ParA family protein [Bifidobacterium lemurum]
MNDKQNRPARIIAMANMKGGVGKTTSTICTAMALSKLGHKVEVRDIDPQGSATMWAARAERAGRPLPFQVAVANRFTVGAPAADPDTWVLIDTPPSQSDLIAAAVDAASLVVLVSTPGMLDLDRMRETARAIDRPSSVLLTQTREHTVALKSARRYLKEHHLARFDTEIPFKEGLRRASETGIMPSATGYGLVASEILEAFAEPGE